MKNLHIRIYICIYIYIINYLLAFIMNLFVLFDTDYYNCLFVFMFSFYSNNFHNCSCSQIGWACTVRWRAGDLMCRIMAFFRTFGVFLSGFLLVVISIDRYSAVLHPLTVTSARIRLRKLILIAWLLAGICSFPQVKFCRSSI